MHDRAWRTHVHEAWVAFARFREEGERESSPPAHPSGSCYGMIAQAFGSRGLSVSYAYAVALRESGCRANAWNPIELPNGHASGIFQILAPGIWEHYDGLCGFEAASPFDAWANVNVAACMIAEHTGWAPWSTG